MVYILNTEVPDRKATKIALQKIFGIGKEKSQEICKHLGISETTPVKLLSTELKNKIIFYIENNIEIGNDLQKTLLTFKENQIRLKCYKGQRAKFKLPRRGQRTRTNARTVKKIYN
jgi:small subunit ribosomal protein S13